MVLNLYKNWRLVSKITWGIWSISGKKWKKYMPSVKTLYTENLSSITFNYLCENSTNSLFHFWNQKSFFTTQLLYVCLAQTLHTFDKIIPSNCKFSDFPLRALKFTNFSCHFSNKKSVFLQSLDHSSVSREIILLYFFSWNLCMLLIKVAHQSENFQTCHCLHEYSPNSSWHFWNQDSVFLQILHYSSVSWDITLLNFFSWNFT